MIEWLPQLHVLDGTKLSKHDKDITIEPVTAHVKEKRKEEEQVEEEVEEEVTVRQPIAVMDDGSNKERVKKRSRGRSGCVSIEVVEKKKRKEKNNELEDLFHSNASVKSWN